MKSGRSDGRNHVTGSAFSPIHRSRDVNNQKAEVPDHCLYDSSYVKRRTVPNAVVPSTAAVNGQSQDHDHVTVEWTSEENSGVARCSVNSSSTSTISDATDSRRGSSFWDTQSMTLHSTASRPPPLSDRRRQTNPPRELDRNGSASKHDGPTPTICANGFCLREVDALTQSRRHDPVSDDSLFRQFAWDDKISKQSTADGFAGRLDPVCDVASGISWQSGTLDTFHISDANSRTVDSKLMDPERRLAERDMELRTLRKTMERNETAMLRVMDDRKIAWETVLARCRADWERRVEDHRDRCERTEYLLKADIVRLESENESLRRRAGEERELKVELKTARASINRLSAELELKHAEIRQLRATVGRHQTPATHCACSVDTGSHQHTVTSSDNGTTPATVTRPSALWDKVSTYSQAKKIITSDYYGGDLHASGDVTSADEVARLREEMTLTANELDSSRRQFDEERRRWTTEKERVITYQKHLQLNYVQMARRSAALETERHQLISELAMAEQYKFAGGPEKTMTVRNAYLDVSHC